MQDRLDDASYYSFGALGKLAREMYRTTGEL